MEQVIQFITDILSETGTLGVTTWLLLGWLFKFWRDRFGEPTNSTKQLVSVAAPFVVVLAAYFTGVLLGAWQLSWERVVEALLLAGKEVIGSKVLFGVSRKIEAQIDPDAAAADHDEVPAVAKPRKRRTRRKQSEGGV